MIKWFQNEKEANDWMRAHPEAHMVCMSAGSISGSLLVGFMVPSLAVETSPELTVDTGPLVDEIAKRRGRPPKVKP